MSLEMGSARIDITPRTPTHLAGYGSRNKPHEGVHDPLFLRCLFVRGAGGVEALTISCDLLYLGADLDQRIRDRIATELAMDAKNILLSGTHTHSAPVYSGEHVNNEWLGALEGRALAAAATARSRLTPVSLHLGRSTCAINSNRRQVLPDGSITLGINPNGPVDREVIVVEARDEKNRNVARLMNYACHGVVLGPKNFLISGDWCGVAAAKIESKLDGASALFLNGGCGDIDPRVRVQARFEPVEELADEFIAAVENAMRETKPVSGSDKVAGVEHIVELPYKLKAVEEGKGRVRRVPLRALQLGPIHIVGFPGEMFCQTAMAVKAGSPHPHLLAASYTDGGHFGYVPVKEAYETGGYEVAVSHYSQDAEAVLRKGMLDILGKFQ